MMYTAARAFSRYNLENAELQVWLRLKPATTAQMWVRLRKWEDLAEQGKKRLLPPKAALGTLRIILATHPFIREILCSLF